MRAQLSSSASQWLARPDLLAVALAAVLATLQVTLAAKVGTDYAAQAARASFARLAPATPVDMSWYSGVLPFGYSVLSPWVMAVLGVSATGWIAAVLSSWLFGRIVVGLPRAPLAASVGAVFFVANVLSGRTTFALGMCAALAAYLLRNNVWYAAVLAVLSALFSPVAAALLCLPSLVFVLRRQAGGWPLGLGAAVPVLLAALLFPGTGPQPFTFADAWPLAVICAAAACLTDNRDVRLGAVLYGVGTLAMPLVPNPVGANVLRLALLLAVPVLLVGARSRTNVWLLAVVCLVVLRWQVDPALLDLGAAKPPPYTAMNQELRAIGAVRVEIVATRAHTESDVSVSTVQLARGWSRQIDEAKNGLFYRDQLDGAAFVSWLHGHSVDHVAVPVNGPYDFGSTTEARLLREHLPQQLTQVWRSGTWVVYAVLDPTPVVQSPATLIRADRTSVTFRAPGSGTLRVNVMWSRWLSVTGPACISEADGQTAVRVSAAGTVRLSSSVFPRGHC